MTTGPLISVQNCDLSPVPLHDKDCTVAAKAVSYLYSISIIACLISQKLLLSGYSVNKDFQFLIGQYQTGIKLIWGNLPMSCNCFHYFIRVSESVMVLKLHSCSFLITNFAEAWETAATLFFWKPLHWKQPRCSHKAPRIIRSMRCS